MGDALIALIAVILMVAVPADWYVAWRLSMLANRKPHIDSLTGAAIRSIAIAVAATLFAVLGVQSLWFVQTGERLLAQPIPTILIALGAIVVSLPNVYFLRMLARFNAEIEEFRRHKRVGDNRERFHRRKDDVPPELDS